MVGLILAGLFVFLITILGALFGGGYLIYSQILAINSINERLLLLAKEATEKERQTMEDLRVALQELETRAVKYETPETEPYAGHTFDPHTYGDNEEIT